MRPHAAWKVRIQIARATGPSRSSSRSRISPAALFVNVIARISFGLHADRVDQVRDAVREDARLAGARAGDHEQRAFGGEHRLALRGIQVGEIAFGRRDGHRVDASDGRSRMGATRLGSIDEMGDGTSSARCGKSSA